MHARIEHLLSLRDSLPVEADVAAHVAQCASCSSQLQSLSLRREQLRSLPQLDADPAAWARIQERLARPAAPSRQRRTGWIAAAAAFVVLSIVAVVAVRQERAPSDQDAQMVDDRGAVDSTEAAHLSELVARSQQLDHLLQRLPQRPRIERVSTAATIDTIEGRIQWLDYQLSYAPDHELSDRQERRLWRERVELMDSLVKVRYAQASQSSF